MAFQKWNVKIEEHYYTHVPDPAGGQHGPVRLPPLRQEDHQQQADHLRLRQGLAAGAGQCGGRHVYR